MFDQMQKMLSTPQAREMLFNMVAQQVAQAPPERKEALARVTVTIKKRQRGIQLDVGHSDDEQVEAVIQDAIEGWADMVSRGFQSMGFSVEIYE
ncbi:MAG: hypothetical protein PHU23_17325 [Dehalococcoidales bacterium]|nr:hypothetical protein [Dehalococcoidales bacterium]